MNRLNGFWTALGRDKHIKVKKLFQKKKWSNFHDGINNQFKIPIVLYPYFESISKPVDEQYRDTMNQIKDE